MNLLHLDPRQFPPTVKANEYLLQCGIMAILFIVSFAFIVWYYERKDIKKKLLYVPVTPIAKEYADLYSRIDNARNKAELKALESETIQFKITYRTHGSGDDLFDNLVDLLKAKRYFLTLENNSLLKAR